MNEITIELHSGMAPKEWDKAMAKLEELGFAESLRPAPLAEKKGKWMQDWRDERGYTHISGYKCSECDALYPWSTNFCPNCGARMEE